MKFPYGIADFHKLITEDYFYVDRTDHIRRIEDDAPQLVFLRPRRFGKSLLLSMIENYYDLAKADQFERLFGKLAVGSHPTPKRNQYFVLKWDFSAVDPSGDVELIRRTLHQHINDRIERFSEYYRPWLSHPIELSPENGLSSFHHLLNAVQQTPQRLYLLIDEYDNFANEVLMGESADGRSQYDHVLRGQGGLKVIFKTVKAAAAGWGLDRVFITGVSPVVLSDLTSGYNVSRNVCLAPQFHDVCGFTEAEIAAALVQVVAECGLPADEAERALAQMRLNYNGYRFSDEPVGLIYNPTLTLYYLDHFRERCRPPAQLLDGNLAMDRSKLIYIAQLPGGEPLLADALNDEVTLNAPFLTDRFGVDEMMTQPQDADAMASLLYYFGVLTIAGHGEFGLLQLRIPNFVIRKLYVERLQALLLPDQTERGRVARDFYRQGDLQPLCEFIEQRVFSVFANRDYRHANELTVKTAFLALLFNDALYLMESETTAGRRYADLTMLVRPEARQYRLWDLLLEFKFVKLGDAGLSGERARALSRAELTALPLVQQRLAEARAQAANYRRELMARHGDELRLRVYAVVALGFDRLVWEEIAE